MLFSVEEAPGPQLILKEHPPEGSEQTLALTCFQQSSASYKGHGDMKNSSPSLASGVLLINPSDPLPRKTHTFFLGSQKWPLCQLKNHPPGIHSPLKTVTCHCVRKSYCAGQKREGEKRPVREGTRGKLDEAGR